MKITINKKPLQTSFINVKLGETFEFCNDLYLKINHCNDNGEDGWCVCLKDYCTCTLLDNDLVTPVDAELSIYPKGLSK